MEFACRRGTVSLMKAYHETHKWPLSSLYCQAAAEGGNIAVLKYLRQSRCKINHRTLEAAASEGNLVVFRWALENTSHDQLQRANFRDAALNGHLEMLQFIAPLKKLSSDELAAAAAGGHLSIIQWLREQQVPWSIIVCAAAAENGQLETLKWLREHGCPWEESVPLKAAAGGHLELLKWAKEHDCPCDSYMTTLVAAQGGHLEVLKWALDANPPDEAID